ncbi:hypothetical protein [Myxococcus sp. AB036A]|uniref:hypothetical protein n=1 Tax=Myxococcus sp. AB036A TaxID=2562793 RepID=UPI001891B7AA|nr:hypothetical protein [Myxococcus sp. AB036A]
MSSARAGAVESLLRTVRPRWVMDLRAVPNFEYGTTTRRRIFSMFGQLGVIYRDVLGLAEVYSREDAGLSSGALVSFVNELIAEHLVPGAQGPILFLLETPERAVVAEQVLPLLVRPQPDDGWVVCSFGVR